MNLTFKKNIGNKIQLIHCDMTFPRSSDWGRKSEDEGNIEGENDAFARKYSAQICIVRKCRSTLIHID
jgi:hypothetical protein